MTLRLREAQGASLFPLDQIRDVLAGPASAGDFVRLLESRREQLIETDIEVCVPVKGIAEARIGARVIRLYSAMRLWMERSGLRIDGPLLEVYHCYGADQIGYRLPAHVLDGSSAEYVTELQAPVAPVA